MIDWGRIRELRSEFGAEDFAAVVDLFLEEASEVVARLGQNPAAGSVEADLHFLKGSALNLGFSALAALCQEGERHAAAGRAPLVDLGQVVACYHLSRTNFLAQFARLTAA